MYENTTPKNVTSFEQLKSYASGSVVELPPFADGQPFVARMRRASMLSLARQGKIPNSLLHQASQLFAGGSRGIDADDENTLKDIFDICEVLARASMVEPTYDDILNAGLTLSDDQIMAIFNYTQGGVKALESFRN